MHDTIQCRAISCGTCSISCCRAIVVWYRISFSSTPTSAGVPSAPPVAHQVLISSPPERSGLGGAAPHPDAWRSAPGRHPIAPHQTLCWPWCTILYYTILYYTILYYTILHYTIIYYYYTILNCTILYYTILYYTILCYAILYYTIKPSSIAAFVWRCSNHDAAGVHFMRHECVNCTASECCIYSLPKRPLAGPVFV